MNRISKFTIIIILLIGVQTVGFAQFSKRDREIVRLIDSINFYKAELTTAQTGNKNFYQENNRLISIIEAQEKEIEGLKNSNGKPSVAESLQELSPPNKEIVTIPCDPSEYNKTISDLRREVSRLEKQNNDKLIVIQKLQMDTIVLGKTVRTQKDTIYVQRKRISALEDSLAYYKGIVNNVMSFLEERKKAKATAREALDEAGRKFEISTTEKSYDERLKMKNEAWSIYSRYTTKSTKRNCGPFTLEAIDDLKNGRDHYRMARLLIEDDGTIINTLDESYCGKINEMNTGMINELGKALHLASNDYSLKADCYNLIEEMASLIIAEKKCWDATTSDQNMEGYSLEATNATINFREIVNRYKNNDYAKAIGLYNNNYRLLELDEMKRNIELVADVKYCIGTILLWNLGDISSYHGLSVKGSWFEKNFSRRAEIGEMLLNDAAKLSSKESILRKNALVVTRKKY